MKKLLTFLMAVVAIAMVATSCNKDNKKNGGVGLWKVDSTVDSYCGSSELYHAWYYYNEEQDGYDVWFSPEDNLADLIGANFAYIDIPGKFCGEERDLTNDLSTEDWVFYCGTKTLEIYGNTEFTKGKVFLSVNQKNNSIVFRLSGTSSHGGAESDIKIEYVGNAKRLDHPVDPRI